jgi:hypothetical protein
MELRVHPFMRRRGVPNWPPIWTRPRKEGNKTTRGEVGILRYVHVKDPISNKCFLVIEHDKEHYVGCLIFDDVAFCSQISNLLRDQVGRPVKEIGDLDLSYTL